MKKFDRKDSTQKGSLMVEALALLGLITMVTPILYKKAAERTTELQDINVATQMRMVSSAVDDFLKDNYNEVGDTHDEDVFKLTDDEREKLDEYLPYGFSTQRSKMFKDFDISVRRRQVTDIKGIVHNIYTAAVLAPLQENITLMRSSKIASMIGANGGIYRSSTGEDGSPEYKLEGVQGTWRADLADYDFEVGEGEDALKEGSLAVVSAQSISSAKGNVNSDNVLYRTGDEGEEFNTMQTTLYMDGNPIQTVSKLIAAASSSPMGGNGSVVIGEEGGAISNLIVTGLTNLKNKLTVEQGGIDVTTGDVNINEGNLTVSGKADIGGDTNIGGNLSVTGDTHLHNTTIEGDLSQSGGDIIFKPNDFTLEATNNVKIDAGGDTTIGGTNVNIAGDTSVNVNVGDKGITINNEGNTINGDTTFNNGDVTINKGDLIVNGGEIVVIPDPDNPEDTNIEADWLYANKGIKIGSSRSGSILTADASGVNINSGELNVRNNFYADDKKAYVTTDSFAVGGEVGDADNKINIGESSAFIGHSYGTGGSHNGLMVEAAKLVLRNDHGDLSIGENDLLLKGTNNGELAIDNTAAVLRSKAGGKVGLEVPGSGESSPIYSLYLDNGELIAATNGIVIDSKGIAIGPDLTSVSSSVDVDGGIDNKLISTADNRKIAISRQGIIEVAAPTKDDNKGGFIRARRLVSDVAYPDNKAFHGYNASGGDVTKAYDYYQVNPAYTSVMNDIKLASRGGARLSDILPDFINKGIYVVDNTYKDSSVGTWSQLPVDAGQIKGSKGETLDECTNNACVASPWLGFVPAPQCPKNYAKVITLSPFRWRMSEVYALSGADDWATTKPSDYKDIITTDKFKKHFFRVTDPRQAAFSLSSSSGDSHTHVVDSGYPLTFQTNTWLNTTVEPSPNDKTSAEGFMGWHAIMGFVYRPTQYSQLLTDIGASTSTNDVYWNIFPVYAQEMAAIASVYCYFDRHPLNEAGTSREWKWGTPVYQYDQLNNFRKGYSKDAEGSAAAWDGYNDPALGYDDAW